MALITQIVNGLLKVNKHVLHESQMEFNATDRILQNVDKISLLIRHKKTEIIKDDNFAVGFFSLKGTNINAIKVTKCSTKICDITSIQNASLSDFHSIGEDETAFVLSDKLVQQIINNKNTVKLIVTVFLENSLFNEEHRQISTSMIFGILLPGTLLNQVYQILFYVCSRITFDLNFQCK